MNAHIIDGKALANQLQTQLKQALDPEHPPTLAVILIGDDPASTIYVHNKKLACQNVGIQLRDYALPKETSQQELTDLIDNLNQDINVNGILVQLPLPAHIQESAIVETIDYLKDVDGFHPLNIGHLAQKTPVLRPCTPYGIITMLKSIPFDFEGAHAVVVGASNIVGLPMALELLIENATVTVCHRFTQDLEAQVKKADLLIVAVGQPNLIKGAWIKPGATVIDVGINRLENGKILGDVEFEEAKKRAAFITPVPGGVGPMTIAILLQNTLHAMRLQEQLTPKR